MGGKENNEDQEQSLWVALKEDVRTIWSGHLTQERKQLEDDHAFHQQEKQVDIMQFSRSARGFYQMNTIQLDLIIKFTKFKVCI